MCLTLLVACILAPSVTSQAFPTITSFGGKSSLQAPNLRFPSTFGFKGAQSFQQHAPSGFNRIAGGVTDKNKFGGYPGGAFGAGGPGYGAGPFSAAGPYGAVGPYGVGGPYGAGFGGAGLYGAGGAFGAARAFGGGGAYSARKMFGGGYGQGGQHGLGGKSGHSSYLLNALKAYSAAALSYNRHKSGYQQQGAYPTLGKQYGAIAAKYPSSLGIGGSYAKYGRGGSYLNRAGQGAFGGFGRQGAFGGRLQQLPYGGGKQVGGHLQQLPYGGGKQVSGYGPGYGPGYGAVGYGNQGVPFGVQGVPFGSFGMLGRKGGFTPYGQYHSIRMFTARCSVSLAILSHLLITLPLSTPPSCWAAKEGLHRTVSNIASECLLLAVGDVKIH